MSGRGRGRGRGSSSRGSFRQGERGGYVSRGASTDTRARYVAPTGPVGPVAEIITGLGNLKTTDFVARPNYNDSGKLLVVEANHFPVTDISCQTVVQYDVVIGSSKQPRRLPRDFCKRVWKSPEVQAVFEGHKVIYDESKLAWSLGPLPFGEETTILVREPHNKSDLPVHIRKVTEINLEVLRQYVKRSYAEDDRVIECLNVISQLLRQDASERFTSIGKGFYEKTFGSIQLPHLAQARRGIFQSIHPTLGHLNVIVDITTRIFWQNLGNISMLNLIERVTNSNVISGLSPVQIRHINSLFRRMKFYTTYIKRENVTLKRIQTFHSLGKPANVVKFVKDGVPVTVVQHFQDAWNYRLKYPTLPVVIAQNQNRSAIPLELCFVDINGMTAIETQPDSSQMAELIKFACVDPVTRRSEIKKNVDMLQWQKDPYLTEFGMTISTEMVKINARQLLPPSLEFYKNPRNAGVARVIPQGGKWDRDQQNLGFIEPKSVSNWAIISCCRRITSIEDIKPFIAQLTQSAKQAGMSLGASLPAVTNLNPGMPDITPDVKAFLRNVEKKYARPVGLVFVIVEDKTSHLYSHLKTFFYTSGYPSQVVAFKSVKDARPNVCRNVLMKVNQKLGGINNKLDSASTPFADKHTLILGADVSHAAPGSSRASLPSVVGCIDLATCKWVGRAQAQVARQEMTEMVKEIIQQWMLATKKPLQRIIYFRDGVSKGQYNQVNAVETKGIEEACSELKIARPKITVIIATKRHHTRFFPLSPDAGDRNGNVIPGTLVEKGVTHPVDFDFFLNSHTAIQGTARPTYYNVIKDENMFKAETLQKAIFGMCHTFGRSTTSISIFYHAHVIGRQASFLLQNPSETQSVVSGSSDDREPPPLKEISPKLVNLMWWM